MTTKTTNTGNPPVDITTTGSGPVGPTGSITNPRPIPMPPPPATGRPFRGDPTKVMAPRGALRDDVVDFVQRIHDQADQLALLEQQLATTEQKLAIVTGELEAAKRREMTLEAQVADRNRNLERERDQYKARVVKITGQFEVLGRAILDCLHDPELVSVGMSSKTAERLGVAEKVENLGIDAVAGALRAEGPGT